MDQDFADLSFSFESQGLPADTFSVISFEGGEGLCELYSFTVELSSAHKDLDLDQIMNAGACLTLKRRQGDVPFHGVLESFTELHEANGLYYYRAVLRPRLWWLTLARQDRVFVDQDIRAVLSATLEDGGLPGDAFELRLEETYPPRDFVCRYGESLYDFFLRWLSRLGMYYFFEQGQGGEKVVVTDTRIAHTDAPGAGSLKYSRTSGLEGSHVRETVHDFAARRTVTPGRVILKDYSYREPELDLTVEKGLGLKGAGETYHFGGHYRSPDEGTRLARFRAEALACEAWRYSGTSFVPGLRPGYTFDLSRHFEDALNRKYLVVSLVHKGYSALAGSAGLGPAGPDAREEGRLHYENSFTAIDAGSQFRPPQVERAAIAGVMGALVGAQGSGQYAELDEEGRYRISLVFDQSGLPDGKASAAVRMLQPYGGEGFGMHCPLHKGTETAVGFTDANPDRPIILGAAPNPDTKSPVTTDNQTQCRLTTGGGNKLHFEDKEGSQRILMQSKTGDFMRIGAHNDPIDWDSVGNALKDFGAGYFSKDGISLYAPGNHWMKITCQNKFQTVMGEALLMVLGWYNEMNLFAIELNMTLKSEFFLADKADFKTIGDAVKAAKMRIHGERSDFSANNKQVSMAEIRASENTTATALSRSQAVVEHAVVSDDDMTLAVEASEATQLHTYTAQAANNIAGEKQVLCQNAMLLSQTRQDLAGQRQALAQESIQTTVSATNLFASRTSTAQDRIATAANKVGMVSAEMNICGLYSRQ